MITKSPALLPSAIVHLFVKAKSFEKLNTFVRKVSFYNGQWLMLRHLKPDTVPRTSDWECLCIDGAFITVQSPPQVSGGITEEGACRAGGKKVH